ncbi:MAG: histidine kinase [Ornithinimicrobium sp.]
MASPQVARSDVADPVHRGGRWLVLGAFAIWVTGLLLWETSWVWGLVVSVTGGAALMVGLTSVARSTFSTATVWGITVPMSVSLVLISQGVSQNNFGVRVVLIGIGALGILLVFLHVLDERSRIEQQFTQRALNEQRSQLAADVHDVVGHTLSASMLHTTAARLAVRTDPAAAIASLERAERHGRRSLEDIRSVVRLLRADGPSTRPPSLGTGEIPALVDEFRSAGVPISYSAPSTIDDLPAATDLTVYRVVQEGLTNAVRHGAGEVAVTLTLTLTRDHDAVHIEIENARALPAVPRPSGSGLAGMRDRVSAAGGTLQSEADHAGSAWLLRASIPT